MASGSPLPTVTWSKNGSILSNSSELYIHQVLVTDGGLTFVESVLRMCNVEESDYWCSADNLIGNESYIIDFPSNIEGRILPHQVEILSYSDTICEYIFSYRAGSCSGCDSPC